MHFAARRRIAGVMTTIDLNGYTDLPGDHLVAVATFLEMHAPPAALDAPVPPGVRLQHLPEIDLATYRGLFRDVGDDWLWTSRLRYDDAALAAVIGDRLVEVYTPMLDDRPVGLLELDFRFPPSAELAYFGLMKAAIGAGIGRWLMAEALRRLWRDNIERVWVHTCTLDHPSALGFYQKNGFRPYARKLEIAPDPRLDGIIAREAGGHFPIIE